MRIPNCSCGAFLRAPKANLTRSRTRTLAVRFAKELLPCKAPSAPMDETRSHSLADVIEAPAGLL